MFTYDVYSGGAICTIRRLDYCVDKMDPMQSGYMWAVFRNTCLGSAGISFYNSVWRNSEFTKLSENAYKVNRYMQEAGLPPVFSDTDDAMQIVSDADYYWHLRTRKQFAWEEALALYGLSGRHPVWDISFFNHTDEGYAVNEAALSRVRQLHSVSEHLERTIEFLNIGRDNIPSIRRIDSILQSLPAEGCMKLYSLMHIIKDLYPFPYDPFISGYKKKAPDEEIVSRMKGMNYILEENGKKPIFRDLTDMKTIYADYDYFLLYRSTDQFEKEEM